MSATPGCGRVTSIACGNRHTVIALASGEICTFGDCGRGRLGLGTMAQPVVDEALIALAAVAGQWRPDKALEPRVVHGIPRLL